MKFNIPQKPLKTEHHDSESFTLQVVNNKLVVTIQDVLRKSFLEQLKIKVLKEVQDKSVDSVIFDVSSLVVIDAHEFTLLVKIMRMAQLMGCYGVITGVNAGTAAFLASIDIDLTNIELTRTLAQALEV
ncbi:MAG: STAS domain-containing protein [Pseudomonadota bacterium]